MRKNEDSLASRFDDDRTGSRADRHDMDRKRDKRSKRIQVAVGIAWAITTLVVLIHAMPESDVGRTHAFENKGKALILEYIEESGKCDKEMDEAISYMNEIMAGNERASRSRIDREISDITGARGSLQTDSNVLGKLMLLKQKRLELTLSMLELAKGFEGEYDPEETERSNALAISYMRNTDEIKGELMSLMDTVNMKWSYDEHGSLRYTN